MDLQTLRQRAPHQLPDALRDKFHKLRPLRIGTVFSGGQAPGGHNVIAGLFDALKGGHLFGFLNGPDGIIQGKAIPITAELLAPYRNCGGFDLLGSGRAKIEIEEHLQASLKAVQTLDLDGLVIIGGDDSNTNAAILAEYFLKHGCKTCVIGVPKTIDGDLQNPYVAISFGFDTACKIYSEMIGNIGKDALSAKKYTHFIKLMGRSASHIALECALATHPNYTIISEERKTLAQIVSNLTDLVMQRSKISKNYGVILIPEGLLEFVEGGLPDNLERDPHGNVNLSAIETEKLLSNLVTQELSRRNFQGKFNPVHHFFGYEGRSGFPSQFDCDYCYALGTAAVLMIHEGHTGVMCTIQKLNQPLSEWQVTPVPLKSLMREELRHGKMKPVIAKALVDLSGKPFQTFQAARSSWALEDNYLCPGPMQFYGDPVLVHQVPLIIQ